MNAIITGATKGIGRAIAQKLAENGFNLVISARNSKELADTKVQLEQLNVKVFALASDLSNKTEVEFFCNYISDKMDKVDVLINNAGQYLPGNLLDEEDLAFESQLQLNLLAPYYLSKFVGKKMRLARSGHIFNVCSIASKIPVKDAGSYSVTKAALLSLNSVLRQELAEFDVKVTAILPGPTLTASWNTEIPKEKFLQAQDVADLIFNALNLSKAANIDQITITPMNF